MLPGTVALEASTPGVLPLEADGPLLEGSVVDGAALPLKLANRLVAVTPGRLSKGPNGLLASRELS